MTSRTAAALAAALALAGCEAAPSVVGCTLDAECGAGNACYRGSCVVNSAPSADFEPPGHAATHRLVGFTASTFDPEGSSVTARWTFRAVAEGCEPEPEPGEGDRIDVVFWCPGRYEATLVPVDAAGLEGAPVVREFDVAASAGAPSVVVAPLVPARHRCDLAVPRCAVLADGGEEALPLQAVGTDPGGETLRFEWRALPPRTSEGDPTLRVTFLPDPFAPAPSVVVENGGGPIAGTWRFRVRAFDPGGLIGQAVVTVEVANVAPYAAPTVASLPHRFEGGAYVAEGVAPVAVVDPDGDAVTISASLSDAPPSCSQSLQPAEGGYRLAVSCTDPADLIGPARALRIQASDVHGAPLLFDIPVSVENRAPVLQTATPAVDGGPELDHSVGPCTLAAAPTCFVAEGTDPFLVADPDGDPVHAYSFSLAKASGSPTAAAAAWLEEGTHHYRIEAPVTRPLDFRTANGSSYFALVATARDPWTASAPTLSPVRIRNRAPVVVEPGPSIAVNHRYDPLTLRYFATAPGPRFADPDGDPLSATVSTSAPCQSATLDAEGRSTVLCERAWNWRSTSVPPLAAFAVSTAPAVVASDGWEKGAALARITILDRAPLIIAVDSNDLAGCLCRDDSTCPSYDLPLAGYRLPVMYYDPDNDPALVTPLKLPDDVRFAPSVGCIGAICIPYLYILPFPVFNFESRVTGKLVADTGTAQAVDPYFAVTLTLKLDSAPSCP